MNIILYILSDSNSFDFDNLIIKFIVILYYDFWDNSNSYNNL